MRIIFTSRNTRPPGSVNHDSQPTDTSAHFPNVHSSPLHPCNGHAAFLSFVFLHGTHFLSGSSGLRDTRFLGRAGFGVRESGRPL